MADQVGWTFLRSRRWLGYVAMFAVFSVACVMLGNWQFERRAEARAEIERIDKNYDAPAVALDEALPGLDAFDEATQKWQTATVTGEYFGEPFLARNRPSLNGVGSHLIAPMRTGAGDVFFVDRGWVDVDGSEAESLDVRDLPMPAQGEVTAVVRLRAGEPAIPGRTSSGRTVASIDLPELATLAGTQNESYTAAYGMLISEAPAGDHGVLPPKPVRDEGPHLSYALQWYVFIAIALIGVGFAARQEYRGLNADSGAVKEQDRRRAERKKKRGPSDAEEEDALINA